MTFIPYANPTQAAATVPKSSYQYSSIVPYANNAQGVSAAANTKGYQSAAANQAAYNSKAVGGGTGGGYVDPYANTVFGSTAKYNQVRGDWMSQQNNTNQSINDRIGSEQAGYNSSILDYLDSATSGQKSLNNRAIQNELARQQGNAGVQDMVGRGLRSGGVVLANRGATNSSAADQLTRAYADIGQRASNQVGNEFAQDQNQLAIDQDAFNFQMNQGARHLNENKTKIVNNIVSDAQNALAKLNSDAANASLTDRVDIEGRKAQIRNQALAALQQYDGTISQAQATARPQDATVNQAEATKLMQAGTAATNPYDFTAAGPVQFQGTGPYAADLPLFTKRRDT